MAFAVKIIMHNIPLSRQRERVGPALHYKDYKRRDAAQRQVRVDINNRREDDKILTISR